MSAYSPQELELARQPIRAAIDRNNAVCVLGHLLTEQRESHSVERGTVIAGITAAVQDFDTRTALGAPAARFQGTGSTPPVAHATPVTSRLNATAGTIDQKASSPASHPIDPTTSMRRELERQGLAQHQAGTASMSMKSMQRELKRAGLTPAARG